MLTPDLLKSKFDAGLPYDDYVATGDPEKQAKWKDFHERVRLTDEQRTLIAGFTREMNVVVISGVWCGDCVQQCPFANHIERVNPDKIRVRFLDRDQHTDLAERVTVCGGMRVPVTLLMNEDWDFVSLFGDRTLARYRAMADRQLGPACPLPGAPVPEDEVSATLADWVNEFERVQLILRLSTKLRTRHAD